MDFCRAYAWKIYCASGHLLGIIEVCNTVKWAQTTVLIICLHFSPFSIDFHSRHAAADKQLLPRRTSVTFGKSTDVSNKKNLKKKKNTKCITEHVIYMLDTVQCSVKSVPEEVWFVWRGLYQQTVLKVWKVKVLVMQSGTVKCFLLSRGVSGLSVTLEPEPDTHPTTLLPNWFPSNA